MFKKNNENKGTKTYAHKCRCTYIQMYVTNNYKDKYMLNNQ